MIDKIEAILGYRFQDAGILTEALTHASIAGHRLESNERLEFLGDAILGYVISEYLFAQFPTLLEGELTKIKSAAVSRKVCARISQAINLSDMLNLGKGMNQRAQMPPSIAAAVLESIIAALYLDGGIEPARTFILRHLAPIIGELAQTNHQHNYKSVLQQYAQRRLPGNPTYQVLDEKGPDHAKCFEVCVEIHGRRFPSAWANSKKEAEQKAALLALHELGLAQVDAHGQIHVDSRGEAADGEGPNPDRRRHTLELGDRTRPGRAPMSLAEPPPAEALPDPPLDWVAPRPDAEPPAGDPRD